MQLRVLQPFLFLLLPVIGDCGLAELTANITGSIYENDGQNSTLNSEVSTMKPDGDAVKTGDVSINEESRAITEKSDFLKPEEMSGSDSQPLLVNRGLFTGSPLESTISPLSDLLHHELKYSSQERTHSLTSSPRPHLRPLVIPRASPPRKSSKLTIPSNSHMLESKTRVRPVKNNKSSNKVQTQTRKKKAKSYHQLKPTAVSSTTTIMPKVKFPLGPPRGVMINSKGTSRFMDLPPEVVTKIIMSATTSTPPLKNSSRKVVKSLSNEKRNSDSEMDLKDRAKFRSRGRLSRAMLHSLTSRPAKNNYKRESSHRKSVLLKDEESVSEAGKKKLVKKNISKKEADIVASLGSHQPSDVDEDKDGGSSSVPLVIITTQAPLIKKVMHKKLIESSKSFKTPGSIHRDSDGLHEPLHSMYGPPYDHYKVSTHRSPGGSFPPPSLPFYQSNHEFLHERFVHTQVPRLLPNLHEKYFNGSDLLLPPYFREEPFFPSTTPAPSLTLRPPLLPVVKDYDFVPPKVKTPKALTYDIDDPYFHPDDFFVPVRKKRPHTIIKAKVKAIKPIVTTLPPKRDHAAPRYSAVADGIPGIDYPNYARIPYTSFSCKDGRPPGIYGDIEAGCQVWHMCEADGRQHSFLCPNGTIFNQQLLTCDWWYNVYCSPLDEYYYKKPSSDVYKPHLNDLPVVREKSLKSLSLPEERKKSNWSPFSNLNLSKRPERVNHHHPAPHLEHRAPPSVHEKPSILSPRGIKGIVTPITIGPPSHFVEFQPYHQDTYPMFQIRKRHTTKN